MGFVACHDATESAIDLNVVRCKEQCAFVPRDGRVGIIPSSLDAEVCGLMHFLELLADSIQVNVIAKRTVRHGSRVTGHRDSVHQFAQRSYLSAFMTVSVLFLHSVDHIETKPNRVKNDNFVTAFVYFQAPVTKTSIKLRFTFAATKKPAGRWRC